MYNTVLHSVQRLDLLFSTRTILELGHMVTKLENRKLTFLGSSFSRRC